MFRHGLRYAITKGASLRTFFDTLPEYDTLSDLDSGLAILESLYSEQPEGARGIENKVAIGELMSFLRHMKRTIQGS